MKHTLNKKQVSQYYERIGYTNQPQVDLQTLAEIQRLHIACFPFENLNPLLNLGVSIQLEDIFQKMVLGGRGGYCFEQNLLLHAILTDIGFKVRNLLGRAGAHEKASGRTHLILLVHLDDRDYIVDTGYGGLVPTAPIALEVDKIQNTPHEDCRIMHFLNGYRLETKVQGEWKRLYDFDMQPQIMMDFEVANWYTSTSPQSTFRKILVAARTDVDIRYSLRGRDFSVYEKGKEPVKKEIQDLEELKEILVNVLKIDISKLENIEQYI